MLFALMVLGLIVLLADVPALALARTYQLRIISLLYYSFSQGS